MSKKKLGKNRLDKYYHLAKECGYRSRAAFKLIQLDQKYNIFSGCSSVVDLCAAPGGWTQVATERGVSLVVAVDMVPMKYISGVESIISDITTEGCYKELLRILGENRTDLFLHDGAPNVGTCWVQDAYSQNELVLQAAKLAASFLRKDGSFLTKVFRSKDYCSLLSVLGKVFESVEATKPLSSRNESAEIFLFCKGFRPEKVHDCLFNPSYVFRDGCEKDVGLNAIKTISFSDLLRSKSPSRDLVSFSRVEYNEKDGLEDIIGQETLALFEDLKVIGPIDRRNILRKRAKILNMIRKGKISIKGLEDLSEAERLDRSSSCKPKAVVKKSETGKRVRKKDLRLYAAELPNDVFFQDKIFDMESSDIGIENDAMAQDSEQISQLSECSESMELDEEEVLLVQKLKENEEDFVLDTVDRYCNNNMDNLPEFIKAEEKDFEKRHMKKTCHSKKVLDYTSRKRRRETKKRAEVVEESDDDEHGAKKNVSRPTFKKRRTKPRVVLSSKGGTRIPKGKGRVKFVDRRMKKDTRKIRHKG